MAEGLVDFLERFIDFVFDGLYAGIVDDSFL